MLYFKREWRDLQFNVDSERQIFEKPFYGNFILTLRVFARNLLRGNRRRNIFCFISRFEANSGFKSNTPTHYLLDYDNFRTMPIENLNFYQIRTVLDRQIWTTLYRSVSDCTVHAGKPVLWSESLKHNFFLLLL